MKSNGQRAALVLLGGLLSACNAGSRAPAAARPPSPAMAPPPSPTTPSQGTPAAREKAPDWDCAFPKPAEDAGFDSAVATILVAVSSEGLPEWVQVVNDPGYNFGLEAAQCAMRQRYHPATDKQGHAIPGRVTIRVRFVPAPSP